MEKPITTVVIDDEYSNRELLSSIISSNLQFSVVGQADGLESGYLLIKEKKPEVVFLDIKMPDGNGFELLSKFDVVNFLVVFVSAFDSYALRAFEFNAVDYVLKPIDLEKFSSTLIRLVQMRNNKIVAGNSIKAIIAQYDVRSLLIQKVAVHSANKVHLLSLHEIVSAVADEGTTIFKTVSGNKHSSSKQLSDFEFIFEGYRSLVRISKSAFININYVESYSKGATCTVFMRGGSDFEVSRRKKTEILSLLTNIK